jgi:Ca2+:H+ antiporter
MEQTDEKGSVGSPRELPIHNGEKPKSKFFRPAGESGRSGIHPFAFLRICFRSTCTLSKYVNCLWPVVPVALALHWARPEENLWNFILPYIAMVPSANLLGFAGQEVARKLPHVLGVILETTFGSVVEIILFMILIKQGDNSVPIIKAAILGSILANLLLCLGLCFFAGGIRTGRKEIELHDAVSEVGSNLMLVAGMGLIVPAAFSTAFTGTDNLTESVLRISRASSIILLLAFCIYVYFQMRTHKGLYEEMLIAEEDKDADRHKDAVKAKLTMTEAILALLFALTMVSIMAVFLVNKIEYIVVERGVRDA